MNFRKIIAGAAACSVIGLPTVASATHAPAQDHAIIPGQTIAEGGICQLAWSVHGLHPNGHIWCLTKYEKKLGGFTAPFLTHSNPGEKLLPSKFYWDVVFVGKVTDHGGPHRGWPFKNPFVNRRFVGDDVVNFEFAPNGDEDALCIQDGPFSENQETALSKCSPVGERAPDRHWTFMLFVPSAKRTRQSAILEVRNMNASHHGAQDWLITSTIPDYKGKHEPYFNIPIEPRETSFITFFIVKLHEPSISGR